MLQTTNDDDLNENLKYLAEKLTDQIIQIFN